MVIEAPVEVVLGVVVESHSAIVICVMLTPWEKKRKKRICTNITGFY